MRIDVTCVGECIAILSFSLGSEAAAATAVAHTIDACASFIEPETIEFKADRPFLFYIREVRSNTVLFTGKLVTPPVN